MEHVTQWLWLWASNKTNVSIKDIQPIENNRQRQRDMLIAKQCKDEKKRENEAALRMAKQYQELDLERLQEEQEQLRLMIQRLKKEQALWVEQLEEESWRKQAEATLTERPLLYDLSDSQTQFLYTATSRFNECWRYGTSSTNTKMLDPKANTVTTAAQTSVNRVVHTTTSPPSIPVVTSVAPPAKPMTNKLP